VLVNNAPGFVGNRLMAAYVLEAMVLLTEGFGVQEVDFAIKQFGFPIGPFQMMDLAGFIKKH